MMLKGLTVEENAFQAWSTRRAEEEDARPTPPEAEDLVELLEGARKRGWPHDKVRVLDGMLGSAWSGGRLRGTSAFDERGERWTALLRRFGPLVEQGWTADDLEYVRGCIGIAWSKGSHRGAVTESDR